MGTDAEDAEAMRRLRHQLDEIGRGYREAIEAGQYGRAAQIASYVVTALAVEVPPEFEAAHDVVLNLTAALQENLAGKTTHPIIAGRLALPGIEQLGFKGALVRGLGAAGVLFLEGRQFSKKDACRRVSAILRGIGVERCSLTTVQGWRRLVDERKYPKGGGSIGEYGLQFSPRIAEEYERSQSVDPEAFVRGWLAARIREADTIDTVRTTLP